MPSAVAVGLAIYVPWKQHRNETQQRRQEEADQVRSLRAQLVAAISAEIAAADDVMDSRFETAQTTAKQIQAARIVGKERSGGPPALRITDGVIYRAAARDVGILPPDLMASIVRYYTLVSELEYVGSMSNNWDAALDVQISMLPRARMTGEMLRLQLNKFKAAAYRDDAPLALSQDEIVAAAREKGYPLMKC